MQCRVTDLRCKEIINICDGSRIGYAEDVEVVLPEGRICAIIAYGRGRFLVCSVGKSIIYHGIVSSGSGTILYWLISILKRMLLVRNENDAADFKKLEKYKNK